MVDLNFWWETGNLSIINGTDIPHQISPVLFLCSLFWPSFSLSFFSSPISFYLLSSCNCRIYKGKIGIRSSPNSGRDPGTFFFLFRKGRSLFFQFSSVTQSCTTLQPHGLQHARLPCPSPIPRAYLNSCPWSWRCHPTILSSVIPFSSRFQSFPESGSFPMS